MFIIPLIIAIVPNSPGSSNLANTTENPKLKILPEIFPKNSQIAALIACFFNDIKMLFKK
jgi:hypothetical protein